MDDGRHQLAPRWFEVQASQISVVVEANARLQLAPGQTKVVVCAFVIFVSVNNLDHWHGVASFEYCQHGC